jgi:hypothetical protein
VDVDAAKSRMRDGIALGSGFERGHVGAAARAQVFEPAKFLEVRENVVDVIVFDGERATHRARVFGQAARR